MVRYESDATSHIARAVFADGTRQRVTVSRERRYPGLVGAAPDTTEAYHAVAARLLDRKVTGRVFDLGAGAGAGAALLAGVGLRVTAVEPSREAVDFARASGVDLELVQASAARAPLHDAAAVVLIDVLGLVSDDVDMLRGIARHAPRDVALLGAVARANLDHPPVAPARRAFTVETLTADLVAAGFEAPDVLAVTTDLIVFETAVAARTALTDALSDARRATTPEAREAALGSLADAMRDPGSPAALLEALLAVGDLQLAREELRAAEETYAAANAVQPDAVRPYAGLAEVRARAGDASDARALYDHALTLDATHAPLWRGLAELQAADGEFDLAAECLAHAAALAPADFLLAGALARQRRQLGDALGALDALARLLPYGAGDDTFRGALTGFTLTSGPVQRRTAMVQ